MTQDRIGRLSYELINCAVIVAHPDDECWCTGTLAAQVDAGLDVHLAVVCNGNMGGMPERSPAERAAVREKEVRSAAQIIGCELALMGVGDDEMMERYTSDYSRLEQEVREVIRCVDPHLLIVPHPQPKSRQPWPPIAPGLVCLRSLRKSPVNQ